MAALLVGAHFPFLVAHAQYLWARPHYQFFPFVLAGAAFLAAQRLRGLGALRPGGKLASYALAALAWLLLALAGLLYSHWLGAVAALVSLAAVIVGLGGAALMRRLLPVWAFLWLLVPPPLNLDQTVIERLQGLVTAWGSTVLDLLGLAHFRAGNVIEVGRRRFLVAEACSGSHSFLALIAVTAFFVVWQRRALVPAALLLAAAGAWVVLTNVARVAGVAFVTTRLGVDVADGWRHEAFGWVLCGVACALLVSTDQLLLFLAPGGRDRGDEAAVPAVFAPGDAHRPGPAAAPAGESPTRLVDLHASWLARWPAVVAYGSLAAGLLWLCWPGTFGQGIPNPPLARHLQEAGADALPARLGSWERSKYKDDPVSELGDFHSHVWVYQSGPQVAVVSADYPFWNWHELSYCYLAQGWAVQDRAVLGGEGPEEGPLVQVKLSRSLDQYGYLLYGLSDGQGRPLQPPRRGEGWLQRAADRMAMQHLHPLLEARGVGWHRPTYQVQVFLNTAAPLTEAEQEQAQALFHQVRQSLSEGARP